MPTKSSGTEEDKNSVNTYFIFQREKIRFLFSTDSAHAEKKKRRKAVTLKGGKPEHLAFLMVNSPCHSMPLSLHA
jgi:hypothetical protein